MAASLCFALRDFFAAPQKPPPRGIPQIWAQLGSYALLPPCGCASRRGQRPHNSAKPRREGRQRLTRPGAGESALRLPCPWPCLRFALFCSVSARQFARCPQCSGRLWRRGLAPVLQLRFRAVALPRLTKCFFLFRVGAGRNLCAR